MPLCHLPFPAGCDQCCGNFIAYISTHSLSPFLGVLSSKRLWVVEALPPPPGGKQVCRDSDVWQQIFGKQCEWVLGLYLAQTRICCKWRRFLSLGSWYKKDGVSHEVWRMDYRVDAGGLLHSVMYAVGSLVRFILF